MIDSKIKVKCTDNGKITDGYILGFNRDKFIDVSLNTVKVRMVYSSKHKQYVGSMAGYEFVVNDDDLPSEHKPFVRGR
jgi:hypothetical protein